MFMFLLVVLLLRSHLFTRNRVCLCYYFFVLSLSYKHMQETIIINFNLYFIAFYELSLQTTLKTCVIEMDAFSYHHEFPPITHNINKIDVILYRM